MTPLVAIICLAQPPQEPVDTLVDADFDIPIEIVETDIHSLEEYGPAMAPWTAPPDFSATLLGLGLTDFARQFLGTRYRPGGKRPGGFDCSGLVGYVFARFGIRLGASSAAQSVQGDAVDVNDLRPGDLLFFSRGTVPKTVGHVGMVTEADPRTGRTRFIHATTRNGVIESDFPDNGHYSARFITARRMF